MQPIQFYSCFVSYSSKNLDFAERLHAKLRDKGIRVWCATQGCAIADGIDFFHMDALSSAVAMKVNCDLQLTLMASSLYRLLAGRIGRGYERTESRHLFRDFVDATAEVEVKESSLVVRYQKRAHNPLLIAAGFDTTDVTIPWLGRKRLHMVFG